MSLCLYHTARCTHASTDGERYLVRVTGRETFEQGFVFADDAETFAASAGGHGVLAEVIDTVTCEILETYGSRVGGVAEMVASQAAAPATPRARERQRNEGPARDVVPSPGHAFVGPSFR